MYLENKASAMCTNRQSKKRSEVKMLYSNNGSFKKRKWFNFNLDMNWKELLVSEKLNS